MSNLTSQISSLASPNSSDTSHSLRFIGLIGLGYWGKNIFRNLYELGALHTACDSDHCIIERHKMQFPDINYATTFEDILRDSEIKAIAIATPATTHYEYVRTALLKGKDVFVEKPLALTVNEGKELVELATRGNRVLMVGHIL